MRTVLILHRPFPRDDGMRSHECHCSVARRERRLEADKQALHDTEAREKLRLEKRQDLLWRQQQLLENRRAKKEVEGLDGRPQTAEDAAAAQAELDHLRRQRVRTLLCFPSLYLLRFADESRHCLVSRSWDCHNVVCKNLQKIRARSAEKRRGLLESAKPTLAAHRAVRLLKPLAHQPVGHPA